MRVQVSEPIIPLVGELDIHDERGGSGAIAAGIPDEKREIISNDAQLIPLEQPLVFNETVLNHINNENISSDFRYLLGLSSDH